MTAFYHRQKVNTTGLGFFGILDTIKDAVCYAKLYISSTVGYAITQNSCISFQIVF